MTIRDEILGLAEADGTIYAEAVVEYAAGNPGSELYQEYDRKHLWDDAVAAREHRLHTARKLIAIHVTFADTGRRAVVSLSSDRSLGGGYRPLLPVLGNQEMRQMLVIQTLNEVDRVLARYPQLDELATLVQAIEFVRRQLEAVGMSHAAD